MNHQLRMLREASRVGDTRQMLERLDMAEDLLDNGFAFSEVAEAINLPVQGNVTPEGRLREALDISRAWPEPALEVARELGADWHALREPARWWRNGIVERDEVASFALEFAARKKRWPRTDEFRRRFGFADGHKRVADGQESLIGPREA